MAAWQVNNRRETPQQREAAHLLAFTECRAEQRGIARRGPVLRLV